MQWGQRQGAARPLRHTDAAAAHCLQGHSWARQRRRPLRQTLASLGACWACYKRRLRRRRLRKASQARQAGWPRRPGPGVRPSRARRLPAPRGAPPRAALGRRRRAQRRRLRLERGSSSMPALRCQLASRGHTCTRSSNSRSHSSSSQYCSRRCCCKARRHRRSSRRCCSSQRPRYQTRWQAAGERRGRWTLGTTRCYTSWMQAVPAALHQVGGTACR